MVVAVIDTVVPVCVVPSFIVRVSVANESPQRTRIAIGSSLLQFIPDPQISAFNVSSMPRWAEAFLGAVSLAADYVTIGTDGGWRMWPVPGYKAHADRIVVGEDRDGTRSLLRKAVFQDP
jgi:hypothetical protein